jgi:ABC-type phosphate/phosphonate transport system substrate-binding protein
MRTPKISFSTLCITGFIVALIFSFTMNSFALDSLTTSTITAKKSPRPLSIAYLEAGLEVPLPSGALANLAAFLTDDKVLVGQMKEQGLAGIHTFRIDSFQDMLNRLSLNEFDVAYCPALIYVEQEGDYTPILQIKPHRTISENNDQALWRGIIIANKKVVVPGVSKGVYEKGKLDKWIQSTRMAFPSAHSAVGFIYPLYILNSRFETARPGGYLFLGSSREVARAVINGLVPVGACEEGALFDVIEEIPMEKGRKWSIDEVLTIIARTPPVPTDPIIVRSELNPHTSPCGKVLRDAIRRFHDHSPGLTKVRDSSSADFDGLKEDLTFITKVKSKAEESAP